MYSTEDLYLEYINIITLIRIKTTQFEKKWVKGLNRYLTKDDTNVANMYKKRYSTSSVIVLSSQF